MTDRTTSAADPPLLGYTVTTKPDPIQVSTASAPATVVINASVAPLQSGEPVYCNQIMIYVYVGTDEPALSVDNPVCGVNRSSWALSESGVKSAEDLGLPGTADDNYYYATFGCSVPADFNIDYLLIFSLTATVNTVPGPFTLNFEENSAMTSDPNSFSLRDTAVPMVKADSVFYLDNFIATVAGTPAVPATEFANGVAAQIVFSWASNGTGYSLFAGNNATPIYTGQGTTFTLPAGAAVDTTYTLQAEQTGNGPAEYLYQTLTLTVSNPDLTPKSVTASGPVSAATLAASGNATVGGALGVTGALTASGGAAVTGGLSTDTLNASGAVSAASAGISGAISANSLSVNGATINGQISASGASISGGLGAGSLTSGWTNLAGAPDYSAGCVSIGGTAYGNVMLMLTNNQGSGYGMHINAPNLGGSWWALCVLGQCINSSGSWSQISDARLKEKIRPFKDGLTQILAVKPVKYHYKKKTGLGPSKEYVGALAEDIRGIAPYMVGTARLNPDDEDEYLSIDSGPLTYMLINAVKELHAEIEELKDKRERRKKG